MQYLHAPLVLMHHNSWCCCRSSPWSPPSPATLIDSVAVRTRVARPRSSRTATYSRLGSSRRKHMHCTLAHTPFAHTMYVLHTGIYQAIVFAGCELALTICLMVHFTTPNMVSVSGGGLSLRNGDLDPTKSHVYLLIWTAAALWYAPISPRPPPSILSLYTLSCLLPRPRPSLVASGTSYNRCG